MDERTTEFIKRLDGMDLADLQRALGVVKRNYATLARRAGKRKRLEGVDFAAFDFSIVIAELEKRISQATQK